MGRDYYECETCQQIYDSTEVNYLNISDYGETIICESCKDKHFTFRASPQIIDEENYCTLSIRVSNGETHENISLSTAIEIVENLQDVDFEFAYHYSDLNDQNPTWHPKSEWNEILEMTLTTDFYCFVDKEYNPLEFPCWIPSDECLQLMIQNCDSTISLHKAKKRRLNEIKEK